MSLEETAITTLGVGGAAFYYRGDWRAGNELAQKERIVL